MSIVWKTCMFFENSGYHIGSIKCHSTFGIMTWRLFELGSYARPGVYFKGENSIVSRCTNKKVIFLLFK